MALPAPAISPQVAFASTVTTLHVFTRHSSPSVGKSLHHAGSWLSVSSQPVDMPSFKEIEWQSSPGLIWYLVPAHGSGVGAGRSELLIG